MWGYVKVLLWGKGGDKYIFVNLVLQFFHKRKKKEEIGDLKVSLNLCMLPGKSLLRISFYLSGKTYRLHFSRMFRISRIANPQYWIFFSFLE